MTAAWKDLKAAPHSRVLTIPGIGLATAAILVAKIVDIDRFETPDSLVNYFGDLPGRRQLRVSTSRAAPAHRRHVHVAKGNDLARAYLWNAARAASVHNPAVRALYRRLRAKGKRGDVATGHCMRKLLHLVFAVWKTNRPFDPGHYPWEPTDQQGTTTAPAAEATTTVAGRRHRADRATTTPWATSGTSPRGKWSPRLLPR